MAEDKKPHEQLQESPGDIKKAQEVHYSEDFKKADKAGEEQRKENEEKKSDDN